MSAIGDYIHFTRQGYNELGVGRKTENKISANFIEIRRQAAQEVISKLKIANEKGLRQTLAELEEIAAGIMDISNARYKDQRAAIEAYLLNKYKNKIKAIDWGSGTITPVQENDLGIGRVHWEYDKDNRELITLVGKVETLAKKVEKMNKILVDQITNASQESKTSLENSLQQLNTLYQEAFAIQSRGESLGIPSSAKIPKNRQRSFKNFQKLMNQLIQDYAPIPPVSLYEGTLWEAIVGAIGTTGANVGVSVIMNYLQQAVVGDDTIEVEFNDQTFMASNTIDKVVKNAKLNLTADEKRRKVDVVLEYSSQDLKISAKNIRISNDLYKWVSAVSTTNFSALVQNISDQSMIDFINHYLNIYTLHSDALGAEEVVSKKLPENKEVNDTMKAYLFFAGLTGVEKQDFPNIFAIHDKKSGRIKFMLMSDVLNTFIENTSKLSVKLNNIPISKFYFKQRWADKTSDKKPEYQRIAALTAALHGVKVKASFNIVDTIM